MTVDRTVIVERAGGVVTLTLNRPEKKNAISNVMWQELAAAVAEVRNRTDDRVLVITGEGDCFCSGIDLTSRPGEAEESVPELVKMYELNQIFLDLHRMPKPTIAKVNGAAVGAGCNLALICDLVVASDGARFSEIFVQRGAVIDGGASWLLPRIIGLQKAKELAFFGDFVSASQAASIGLVNKVVAADALDAEVEAWATRLAAGPALALSMVKAMLNGSIAGSMDDALETEARCQHIAFATDNRHAAFRAFKNGTVPVFSGW
jgi:2-(1,2-epoxy-1,2-dihydrophenyl)acetyl-CoA isomerase